MLPFRIAGTVSSGLATAEAALTLAAHVKISVRSFMMPVGLWLIDDVVSGHDGAKLPGYEDGAR
jgi:hypothetical protein